MKLLPYENITYHSDLSAKEIMMRLKKSVEPKKWMSIGSREKPYQGEINKEEQTFKISRIINYRNSFLPQITGKVIKGNNGTEVTVKMKLHPLVFVFIIIWLGFVGGIGGFLSSSSFAPGFFEDGVWIPLGMLMLGLVISIGAFKWESAKSKAFLESLLEASKASKKQQGFNHFKS